MKTIPFKSKIKLLLKTKSIQLKSRLQNAKSLQEFFLLNIYRLLLITQT